MAYHLYDSDKELFQFYFSFSEKDKDFFFLLHKMLPFVYYLYSKRKLEEDVDTFVFTAWPDTNNTPREYRFIGRPIYTGIKIPFEKEDNFLSTYEKALFDLHKDINREKQPDYYYIFPFLLFKEVSMCKEYEDKSYTSFVEYYGELWGFFHYYLNDKNTPESDFTINHGEGYQRFTDVNKDFYLN